MSHLDERAETWARKKMPGASERDRRGAVRGYVAGFRAAMKMTIKTRHDGILMDALARAIHDECNRAPIIEGLRGSADPRLIAGQFIRDEEKKRRADNPGPGHIPGEYGMGDTEGYRHVAGELATNRLYRD